MSVFVLMLSGSPLVAVCPLSFLDSVVRDRPRNRTGSPSVPVFFIYFFSLGGNVLSTLVEGSNDSLFVFKRVIHVKQ